MILCPLILVFALKVEKLRAVEEEVAKVQAKLESSKQAGEDAPSSLGGRDSRPFSEGTRSSTQSALHSRGRCGSSRYNIIENKNAFLKLCFCKFTGTFKFWPDIF